MSLYYITDTIEEGYEVSVLFTFPIPTKWWLKRRTNRPSVN